MNTTFTFLHISDLHFAKGANRLPSPLQKVSVDAIVKGVLGGTSTNWLKPASHSTRAAKALSRYLESDVLPKHSPDILLITGDLAATGSVEDLEVAKEYIGPHRGGAWANRMQEPILAVSGLSLALIPGNHDRYREGTLKPGSMNFEQVFSSEWKPQSNCGRVSTAEVLKKNGLRVAVIGADFTLRAAADCAEIHGYFGKGKVHSDVLSNLVDSTARAKESLHCSAVVWLVHFPPRFLGIDPNLDLDLHDTLIAAAESLGVCAIFCGHTHKQSLYKAGGVIVCCAGSATESSTTEDWQFSVCDLSFEANALKSVVSTNYQYESWDRNNFKVASVQTESST